MQRLPYIREDDRCLMVPTEQGMVSASFAIKNKLSVNGHIYKSEAELQQALIKLQLEL
jgi:hypothetical protein